jgi:hypothetical protein
MAAATTTDLKVVVSIVQQNAGEIQGLLGNLKSLLSSVKDLGAASLGSVQTQIKGLGDTAKATLTQVRSQAKEFADAVKQAVPQQLSLFPDNASALVKTPQVQQSSAAIKALQEEVETLKKKLQEVSNQDSFKKPAHDAEQAGHSIELLDRRIESLTSAVKFLTGGFLALEGVRFLRELANEAARTEVLGTVLHVVGNNAGYTNEKLDTVDKAVQHLGITAEASRRALTQLIQADLSLDFAPKLARAAQDLAVISGENSSATLSRMVTNIEQLDTVGLRWMGIVVSNEQAQQRFATSINKTAGALSQQEKQQALLIAVTEKAQGLAGTYEAAMGDVGKQLTSLERYTQNLKVALGESLLPAYSALVEQYGLLVNQLTVVVEGFNTNKTAAQTLGEVLGFIASTIREVIVFFAEHYKVTIALATAFGVLVASIAGFKALSAAISLFKSLRSEWTVMKTDIGALVKIVDSLITKLFELVAAEKVVEGAQLNLFETGGAAAATAARTSAFGALVGVFESIAAAVGLSSLALGGWIVVIAGAIAIVNNAWGIRDRVKEFINPGSSARTPGSQAYKERQTERSPYEKNLLLNPNAYQPQAVKELADADQKKLDEAEAEAKKLQQAVEDPNLSSRERALNQTRLDVVTDTIATLQAHSKESQDAYAKIPPAVRAAQFSTEELNKTQNELIAALDRRTKASDAKVAARFKNPVVKKAADEAYEQAQEAVARLEKKRDDLIKMEKVVDAEAAKADLERVDALGKEHKAKASGTRTAQAEQQAGIGQKISFDDGRAYSPEYARLGQTLATELEDLKTNPEANAKDAAATLRFIMQELGDAAKFPEDLRNLPDNIDTFRQALAAANRRLSFDLKANQIENQATDLKKSLVAGGMTDVQAEHNARYKELVAQAKSTRDEGLKAASEVNKENASQFLTPEANSVAANTRARAALAERDAQKAINARINADAKAMMEARSAAAVQQAQEELDTLKQSNALKEQAERQSYEHGLLDQGQYFANRLSRLKEEYQKEAAVQDAEVARAKQNRDFEARTGNPAEAQQAETAYREAQARRRALDSTYKEQTQGVAFEQANAAEQSRRSLEQLRIQQENLEGGGQGPIDSINEKYRVMGQSTAYASKEGQKLVETMRQLELAQNAQNAEFTTRELRNQVAQFASLSAEIDVINLRYDRMLDQYKNVKGSDVWINQARQIEQFKNAIDQANKSLEASVGYERARINAERQQISSQQNRGTLSEIDARRRNNELTAQEIAQTSREIQEAEQELAGYTQKRLQAAEAIRNANPNLAGAELDAKIAEGTSAFDDQILKARTHIEELHTEALRLGDQIETYGQKLQKDFTEGLSQAITQATLDYHNAAQSFVDFGRHLQEQIIGSLAEKYTKSAINKIVDATKKPVMDPKTGKQAVGDDGKPVFKSPFDVVAQTLGLDKKDAQLDLLAKSKSTPMWVRLADGAGGKGLGGLLGGGKGDKDSFGNLIPDVGMGTPSDPLAGIFDAQLPTAPPFEEASDSVDKFDAKLNSVPDKMEGTWKETSDKSFGDLTKSFGSLFGGMFSGGSGGAGLGSLFGLFGAAKASGGMISGRGTSTSDSIPAMLSNGEFVVRASQTSKHLGLLTGINSGYNHGG